MGKVSLEDIREQHKKEIKEWKKQNEKLLKEKHDLVRKVDELEKDLYYGKEPKSKGKKNRKKGS